MKKNIAILAILTGVLMMTSCIGVSHLGIYDESIPEESQCFLEVRDDLNVITFNNRPVSWSPSDITKNKFTIYVPPGENTFLVTYLVQRQIGLNLYTSETVSATVGMEFIPGHRYQIYKENINLLLINITNVKIKEITSR